ncbi:MAG TPA: VWA domain-containing protein [Thermoanaerobaculia bacterium]|nr:VWA domain-containing protein [Thermoanaerobaculia bacterium]HUM29371.1 VWA domain-containing protein [Thermoanaerobaculia bacterium]
MRVLWLLLLLAGGQWGEVVTVRYVMFNVSVTDAYGKPQTHLRRDDFTMWVDLNQVRFDHFSHDFSAPVSTLILLDDSGSMDLGRRPNMVKAVIQQFLRQWREGDEHALISFQNRSMHTEIPFPGSKRGFFDFLAQSKPRGQTALYDALLAVQDEIQKGSNERKQIILITDSHDNYSSVPPGTAIQIIQELEVPVHVICVPLSEREPLEIKFLLSLAKYTGGTLHVLKRESEIEEAVSQILALVHHQYLLGFAPDTSKEVQYRRVQIDVKGKHIIRTRKGYKGYPPRTQ